MAPPPVPPRAGGDTQVTTKLGVGSDQAPEQRGLADRALKLKSAFSAELENGPPPERAARLHYELGRLYEGPLRDEEQARDHYLKSLAVNPDHVPTLHGTRRILIARRYFQDAVPLYDAEIKATGDARRKSMLLYEKGRLLEDQMGQSRDARGAYAAALELDQQNKSALKALERLQHQGSEHAHLVKTLERAANAVSNDPQHRAALIGIRARLAEVAERDEPGAIEHWQTAINTDSHTPGALVSLKRLLYAHGRWQQLIDVLQREAASTQDKESRALALARIARIQYDRLGNLDGATVALERAAQETGDDPLVLESLARLYETGKKYALLTGVLERLVDKTTIANQRVGLLHRIGQLCEERLEDEDAAAAWYRRALDSEGGYLPALQALGALYTREQRWLPLIQMHLGEVESVSDDSRRAAALARIAAVYETKLGDVTQARAHHERAALLVPGYGPSFKALVRLLSASQDFRALVELYDQAIERAETNEVKITYLFKVGRIYEDALNAPGAALSAYRRVLEIDPGHLGAIHAWQRAAERAGMYKELVQALELEAEKTTERRDVVALLHRAAEVFDENIHDRDAALLRYRKVLAIDGGYSTMQPVAGRTCSQRTRLNSRWIPRASTRRRCCTRWASCARSASAIPHARSNTIGVQWTLTRFTRHRFGRWRAITASAASGTSWCGCLSSN